jgi:serine/threonine protein kinase
MWIAADLVHPIRKLTSNSKTTVLLAHVPHSICKSQIAVLKSGRRRDILHEAQALAQLQHSSHIVKLYGVCAHGYEGEEPFLCKRDDDADGWATLVLEHASRGDVFEYASTRKRGVFGDVVARRIAQQIVRALDDCHKAGIVHMDVKSENVLVRRDCSIALCDFEMWGRTGMMVKELRGTTHSIPPEVYGSHPSAYVIEPSIDIWAVGILVFELLRGVPLHAYLTLPASARATYASSDPAHTVIHSNPTVDEMRLLFSRSMRKGAFKFDRRAFVGVSTPARDFVIKCCCAKPVDRPCAQDLLSSNCAWFESREHRVQGRGASASASTSASTSASVEVAASTSASASVEVAASTSAAGDECAPGARGASSEIGQAEERVVRHRKKTKTIGQRKRLHHQRAPSLRWSGPMGMETFIQDHVRKLEQIVLDS